MEISRHKLQRRISVAFVFAAVVFVGMAILWPAVFADIFRSRWVLSLLAVLSSFLAFYIHPDIRSGLTLGFREFRKAAEDVAQEIGGDDDDGPRAV